MLRLLQRATTRALVFLSVLFPAGAMAQFGVPAPVTPAIPCPAFTGFPLSLNLGSISLFGNDGITNRCAFQTTQAALNALSTQAASSVTAIANNAAAIASEVTRATAAEALRAPLANPTFAGTVTSPQLALTGLGSTGDITAMSLTAKLGTLQRRLDDKLSEMPLSVEDFRGGSCAGSNDDTCAIKATVAAACAAGSAEARLFKPSYQISDTITLPANCNSVWLHGVSAQGTVITSTALSKPIVQVSGIGNRVGSFQLAYQGTPISGAIALSFVNASNPTADNFITYNTYVGLKVSGGSGLFLSNYQLFNHSFAGLWADSTVDVFSSNSILNAGNATNASAGNVRLSNKVEAFVMTNADTLLGKYSLITDATVNTANNRPAYNKFIGVYFDSGFSGSIMNNTVLTDFIGSWFSGGRGDGTAATAAAGLTLNNTNGISFSGGTTFFNNGGNGLVVNSTATRTIVNGAHAHSNSVTAGSGVGHGIVANGATDFVITNTTSGNDLYPGGQQGYGIVVLGAANRYSITNNLTQGNQASGVLDQGTGTSKLVQANW